MSVLSRDLLPPKPSHSLPSLSLFSSLLFSPLLSAGCVFMGTGGRLRWSILSYSLFWCAGTDRDRGSRTGALGVRRGKKKLKRTRIDTFGHRKGRTEWQTNGGEEEACEWWLTSQRLVFTSRSTLRTIGLDELKPGRPPEILSLQWWRGEDRETVPPVMETEGKTPERSLCGVRTMLKLQMAACEDYAKKGKKADDWAQRTHFVSRLSREYLSTIPPSFFLCHQFIYSV